MALLGQLRSQRPGRLGGPAKRRQGVAGRGRPHEGLQVRHDAGVPVEHLLAASPGRRERAGRADGDLVQLQQPNSTVGREIPRRPADHGDASPAELTGPGGNDQPA